MKPGAYHDRGAPSLYDRAIAIAGVSAMNQADALMHIRTLVKVASEIDNLDLIREHHREILALIAKALPKEPKWNPAGTADLHGVPKATE